MKELSIKRALDKKTRKQSIWIPMEGKIRIFSLHITPQKEVIITDDKDYTKIYEIISLDYYNAVP